MMNFFTCQNEIFIFYVQFHLPFFPLADCHTYLPMNYWTLALPNYTFALDFTMLENEEEKKKNDRKYSGMCIYLS